MPPRGWGIALLFSFAVLPVSLSLVARFAGLDAAVAVQLVLAAAGIPATRKMGWPPLWSVLGLLACSLVVGWATIDFRFGGNLYQPTVAVDMVKHVATVNSMVSWGLPLTDPFVSRVQPAGYYYFFYTLAAVPVRLTMGVIDARAAVGALAVLDGAASLALAGLLWRKAEPDRLCPETSFWPLSRCCSAAISISFLALRRALPARLADRDRVVE